MSSAGWNYPSELVAALPAFGLLPTSETPPALVRDQLNDLYRFEIRRLRARLITGEFPKADYVPRVVALRKKYWPLSLTPGAWEKLCVAGAVREPAPRPPR
jgi:hypothetical protein